MILYTTILRLYTEWRKGITFTIVLCQAEEKNIVIKIMILQAGKVSVDQQNSDFFHHDLGILEIGGTPLRKIRVFGGGGVSLQMVVVSLGPEIWPKIKSKKIKFK